MNKKQNKTQPTSEIYSKHVLRQFPPEPSSKIAPPDAPSWGFRTPTDSVKVADTLWVGRKRLDLAGRWLGI